MEDTTGFVRRSGLVPKIAVLAVVVVAVMMFGPVTDPLQTEAGPENAPSAASWIFQGATPVADEATPVTDNVCETLAPGVGSEPWVRTELYFGTSIPDGSEVTDEEWQAFLDEEVTPRFPDGLTVLEGYGQFLNSSGVIAEEGSIVLIIFYPPDAIDASSASIEEIRDAYETQFDQESVLRADTAPTCISF